MSFPVDAMERRDVRRSRRDRRDVIADSDTMFVSWADHARARELAEALGAELYIPGRVLSHTYWPLRYVIQGALTFLAILRRRPARILFTNPPFVAGLPILMAARLRRATVWCDAHSGAFNDQRWARFAGANRFVLRRCTGTVLASARLARDVKPEGESRTLVVASPPLQLRDRAPSSRPLIVATLGWAWDEPVRELLDAAALVPDIEVVLTGHAPREARGRASANCTFSTWLPREDYRALLARATAVICLTTRESTMQTGAYEAAEHGTPMILSGTLALREYFNGGGVLFVENHEPDTLAAAMRTITRERANYELEAHVARATLVARSTRACEDLKRALAGDAIA